MIAHLRPDEDILTAPTLGELYHEHLDGLVRLAALLSGSPSNAPDLVHDAFCRLAPRFDRVRNPLAYLRVSVVNGARDHHRRRARDRDRLPRLVTADASPESTSLTDILATLPDRQRAALVLRFYEDRTDSEIADAIGCRPATVRSLVRRGLARLRVEVI